MPVREIAERAATRAADLEPVARKALTRVSSCYVELHVGSRMAVAGRIRHGRDAVPEQTVPPFSIAQTRGSATCLLL